MEGKSPDNANDTVPKKSDLPPESIREVALSEELVYEKWSELLETFNDRLNLKSSLSRKPVIREKCILLLELENTLQEEIIKNNKPGLLAWLRRELNEPAVELVTEIKKQVSQKVAYTDGEKLDEMMQKNMYLQVLKQRFHLDFDEL